MEISATVCTAGESRWVERGSRPARQVGRGPRDCLSQRAIVSITDRFRDFSGFNGRDCELVLVDCVDLRLQALHVSNICDSVVANRGSDCDDGFAEGRRIAKRSASSAVSIVQLPI